MCYLYILNFHLHYPTILLIIKCEIMHSVASHFTLEAYFEWAAKLNSPHDIYKCKYLDF